MTARVSEVMGELRQDHRNLKVLLDVLEREIGRLESEQDTDFELLHDIMVYMTGYPDAVHHKKEDWVYARMAAVRDSLQPELERIEGDHADISRFGERLLGDINEIQSGAMRLREAVVDDARRYLTRQRDHMAWEDRYMFPLADSMQQQLDLDTPSDTVAAMPDPVFGADVERSFRALYSAIEQEGRN